MNKYAVYKSENYDNIYSVVAKHFEAHNIRSELTADTHVLLKPNLVTDKEAAFSITTNPDFVFAVIKYLRNIGVERITVADCPGGALLLFSKMQDVYKKCGYDFLSEFAELNLDFNGVDIKCPDDFDNKEFNVIKAVLEADYIINLPKFKTHNTTCITAGVKNLFGCIPGLQKPEFHAKYPKTSDFSNMLVVKSYFDWITFTRKKKTSTQKNMFIQKAFDSLRHFTDGGIINSVKNIYEAGKTFLTVLYYSHAFPKIIKKYGLYNVNKK